MVFVKGHPCYIKKHKPETIEKMRQTKLANREDISKKSIEMWKTRDKSTISNWIRGGEKTRFKKGSVPPNKGKQMSDDFKKKVSIGTKKALKGKIPWNKGLTKETSEKVKAYGLKTRGKIVIITKETKRKISKSNIGNSKINATRKGKTYKDFFGEEKARNIRKKLRESYINHIENVILQGQPIYPMKGKYEIQILNNLEKYFNVEILRQYKIDSFFLDGYCPEINLAIEVDEKYHFREDRIKKDVEKQNYIQEKLGCQFLRVPTIEVI